MAVRIAFDKELDSLINSVRLTSARLEETVDKVVDNLSSKNEVLARSIVKNDDEFDGAEHEIQDKCLKLILTQAPVASDLREIVGIIKMISDIERIADHCSDISKYTAQLAQEEPVKMPEYFKDMVNVMQDMVHDAVACFNKSDVDLAEKVYRTDDVVDNYFSRLRQDIETMIESNPKQAEQYVNYLMAGKYVERIADHTTNIAEWVKFIVKNELK